MSADWCLFDAVQRLKLETDDKVNFDMLEGMTVLKTDQSFHRDESQKDRPNFYKDKMTRIVQIGRGVLPVEYWLDSSYRLVLVTSGDRAYILEDDAEERFEREVTKHQKGGYSWKNKL